MKKILLSLLVLFFFCIGPSYAKKGDWSCSSASECSKSSIGQDFLFTQTQALYLDLLHDKNSKQLLVGLRAKSFRNSDNKFLEKPTLLPATIYFDEPNRIISTKLIYFGKGLMLLPIGVDKHPAMERNFFIPTLKSSKRLTIEIKVSEFNRASVFSWDLENILLVSNMVEKDQGHEYAKKNVVKSEAKANKQPNKEKVPNTLKSSAQSKDKKSTQLKSVKNKQTKNPDWEQEQFLQKQILNCESKLTEKYRLNDVSCSLNLKDSYIKSNRARLNLRCNSSGQINKLEIKATCFLNGEQVEATHAIIK